MAAVEKAGTPLPNATLDSIRPTRLCLKGPLTTPVGGGYRSVKRRDAARSSISTPTSGRRKRSCREAATSTSIW